MGGFWANGWNIRKILYLFLGTHLHVREARRRIFTLDGLNDADSRNGCAFWGFRWYCSDFGSEIPPPQKKLNFGGVNRCFQAKRAKYWKFHIIETTASISTKFSIIVDRPKLWFNFWWHFLFKAGNRVRTYHKISRSKGQIQSNLRFHYFDL